MTPDGVTPDGMTPDGVTLDGVTLVNLTPHPIVINGSDGGQRVIPPRDSGRPAHCSEEIEQVDVLDGVPLVRLRYGQVTGLPDPTPGTWYIVSLPVRLACPERTDILVPAQQTRGPSPTCRSLAISVG